jgi:hypothetical protein
MIAGILFIEHRYPFSHPARGAEQSSIVSTPADQLNTERQTICAQQRQCYGRDA